MSGKILLAFDLGASGGRAVKGTYEKGRLLREEVHRFENIPVERDGSLFWDFDFLLREVRAGLEKAGPVDSLSFDTWGVDFGLLGKDGGLLAPPVHYRDGRTRGLSEKAAELMDPDLLYACTGNQIMDINTLFQLMALKERDPGLPERADRLLFMPDLLAYSLCGTAVCERSIASTSQLLDPRTKNWSREVLEAFGLPARLLLLPVESGTVIGEYRGARVVAGAGHDTQCAAAAMPARTEHPAFLSCGTWSLLGCELSRPILTGESRRAELSNELGAGGTVDYLKNIIGLWLIQESRREWRRQGREYSYADLERLALEAEPFRCFIDPDAPEFAPPGDIPGRVREFCRRTGQPVPETPGEVMRCVYESLALKYALALEQLETMTGQRFDVLHVLGGGAKDGLLCRMTADSLDLPVEAGPVEATALGNLLIQLMALGEVSSLKEGRAMLAGTEPVKRYEPERPGDWREPLERYRELLSRVS